MSDDEQIDAIQIRYTVKNGEPDKQGNISLLFTEGTWTIEVKLNKQMPGDQIARFAGMFRAHVHAATGLKVDIELSGGTPLVLH